MGARQPGIGGCVLVVLANNSRKDLRRVFGFTLCQHCFSRFQGLTQTAISRTTAGLDNMMTDLGDELGKLGERIREDS